MAWIARSFATFKSFGSTRRWLENWPIAPEVFCCWDGGIWRGWWNQGFSDKETLGKVGPVTFPAASKPRFHPTGVSHGGWRCDFFFQWKTSNLNPWQSLKASSHYGGSPRWEVDCSLLPPKTALLTWQFFPEMCHHCSLSEGHFCSRWKVTREKKGNRGVPVMNQHDWKANIDHQHDVEKCWGWCWKMDLYTDIIYTGPAELTEINQMQGPAENHTIPIYKDIPFLWYSICCTANPVETKTFYFSSWARCVNHVALSKVGKHLQHSSFTPQVTSDVVPTCITGGIDKQQASKVGTSCNFPSQHETADRSSFMEHGANAERSPCKNWL